MTERARETRERERERERETRERETRERERERVQMRVYYQDEFVYVENVPGRVADNHDHHKAAQHEPRATISDRYNICNLYIHIYIFELIFNQT